MGDGSVWGSLRAKQNTVTVKGIRQKVAEGRAHGHEKAVVVMTEGATKLLTGQEDVSSWSDTELYMGTRMGRNNKLPSIKPMVVPREVMEERIRRITLETQETLQNSLKEATNVLLSIMKDKNAEPKDRLKAVSMVMDRVMGKAPEKVVVKSDSPWILAISDSIGEIEPAIVPSFDIEGESDDD